MFTVEDYLETLVGLTTHEKFDINRADFNFLGSIARQVFKGVGLTDRQHAVVKEKLLTYKEQFETKGIEFLDENLDNLRIPLREIDRKKYIKICRRPDANNGEWIKIRFPFSKKIIVIIESLVSKTSKSKYFHAKGSHEHFFYLDEQNAFNIVEQLNNKSFEIEERLITLHEKLLHMKNNKINYLPGIYNFKLKNLNENAKNFMISSIGEPDRENLALYKDRQELYGLNYFDQLDLDNSMSHLTVLGKKIALRSNKSVFVQDKKYTINNVAEALLELNRFPLLVVLSETTPLDDLYKIHHAFNGFIENSECTVNFRLDNDVNSDFNEYIKNNNLNSKLDKDVKIVYTNNNNITKPLLESNWTPMAVLLTSSHRLSTKVTTYIEQSDLIIHYDDQMSVFTRGIEKL